MATFQPPPLREQIYSETGLSLMWRSWFNLVKDALGKILTIPTGTGFRHVTAGVEDAASKLVENADVKPTAAIVESKLAFNITTGHAHTGTDSKKVDHGNLDGLTDDDHTQYIKHSLATAISDFLVASDIGIFVKKTLAEVKTILGLGSAAYTASTDYAPAAQGVTNGNTHDHVGGDGAQIDHGGLAGLLDDDHTQYLKTTGRGVVGLSIYANNAAALAGGLGVGAFYRSGGDPDIVCVVH